MAETPPTAPLDLSAIEGLDTAAPSSALVPSPPTPLTTAVVASQDSALDSRLVPQPRAARLVEVSKLGAEDLDGGEGFRRRQSISANRHPAGARRRRSRRIAQASRQLLTGVRLGDAGEVGPIAAAVIDGVKILRIQDLQAEARAGSRPPARVSSASCSAPGGRRPHRLQGISGKPQEVPRPDGPGSRPRPARPRPTWP